MPPPPATTPTSRSSSVHMETNSDVVLNNGGSKTSASAYSNPVPANSGSANPNSTGHPNALPGYLPHPQIHQQLQQQSLHNSSRWVQLCLSLRVWDNVVSLGLRPYGVQRAMCCSCLLACACFSFSVFCQSFSNTKPAHPQHFVIHFLISWPCSSWFMSSFYCHINNNFGVSAFFFSNNTCISSYNVAFQFIFQAVFHYPLVHCMVHNSEHATALCGCFSTYLNLKSPCSGQQTEFKPQYH